MRRTVAISLMMLFGWTLIAPMLVLDAEANHSACCCCKNGKHRCMCGRHRAGQSAGNQKGFTTVGEKCPCSTANIGTVYSPSFKLEAAKRFDAVAAFHPARSPQGEAFSRIWFLRCHPKRGPPAPLA
jgi:hypothetical protein